MASPLRPAFAPSLAMPSGRGHVTATNIAPRRPRVAMSTAGAELRRRIQSVRSAEKIVSSLRLVAAARIRSTSLAALRARPFAEELQHILATLTRHIAERRIDISAVASAAPPVSVEDMHGPLLADPAVQKALLDRMYLTIFTGASPPHTPSRTEVTLLTVIAADRKFCGSYNKVLLMRAFNRLRDLRQAGETVELVVVGRVAQLYFMRMAPSVPIRWYAPFGPLSEVGSLASSLSNELLSEFVSGGVRRVEVLYTRFLSLIATAPSSRTLLPLTPTGVEAVGDELYNLTVTSRSGRIVPTRMSEPPGYASKGKSEYVDRMERTLSTVSDEDAVLLLNSMVPMYVTSQIIRIVREAVASEQASRLAAMTAATDNARELISSLQTQFNKQRQARITNEIIEVSSSTRT